MSSAVRSFLSFFAAAIVGGIVVWWLGGSGSQPGANEAAHPAPFAPSSTEQVAEVTQMPAAARVRLGGYVEARNSVRLTAQGPGRVTFVAGQEGERIQAGQTVVALDDDSLKPEYRAAWAQLAGEMADSQNAQTQLYHNLYGRPTSPMGGPAQDAYERMTVPFYNMAQGFMGNMFPGMSNTNSSPFGMPFGPMQTQSEAQKSYPAINNHRADYERRLAGLAGAQSRVDVLDTRLRDRRSIAPWSSVIMKRHVRVGDIVQPGQPLADIADVDQLDLRIEVPASQIGNLAVGDRVPVSLGAQNGWAVVGQIFPAADGAQRTVTVKLALPPEAKAAPGMYALAWIAQPGGGSPTELAPAIPTTAIAWRGSLPIAFAVGPTGYVEMRVLRLGDAQGDRTAVLSGLTAGERVVLNPAPHLKAGAAPGGVH